MESLPISKITIDSHRQRRQFNDESLASLASSITENELFHAIVLQKDSDTLVAGERRLKAITLLYTMGGKFTYNGEPVPEGHVPFTRMSNATPEKIYEAELVENLQRENLTVQEEIQAIAELHKLRVQQDPAHSPTKTAEELTPAGQALSGSTTTKVTDSVAISEYLDRPEVKQAKNFKQAKKAVEKIKNQEYAAELAKEFSTNKAKENHKHVALQGNCIELLRKMPDHCVDVVCTDPPYGIDAQDFGTQTSIGHKYDDSYPSWQLLMVELADELFRVTKHEAHAYIFCDFSRWTELAMIFSAVGFQVWKRPLIWSKNNGMLPHPNHGPRYSYETILFISKGAKETRRIANDVINVSAIKAPRHAAEKPVELFTDLLSRSCLPGNHVLDPFMGSGPIFPAANELHLQATGFELEDEAFGFAVQRLDEQGGRSSEPEEPTEPLDLNSLMGG